MGTLRRPLPAEAGRVLDADVDHVDRRPAHRPCRFPRLYRARGHYDVQQPNPHRAVPGPAHETALHHRHRWPDICVQRSDCHALAANPGRRSKDPSSDGRPANRRRNRRRLPRDNPAVHVVAPALMGVGAVIVGWLCIYALFVGTRAVIDRVATVPLWRPSSHVIDATKRAIVAVRTFTGVYKTKAPPNRTMTVGDIVKANGSLFVIRTQTAVGIVGVAVLARFSPSGMVYFNSNGPPTLLDTFEHTELKLTVSMKSFTNKSIVPVPPDCPAGAITKWDAFSVRGSALTGTTDFDKWAQHRLMRRMWVSNIYCIAAAASETITELNFANSNFGNRGLQIITKVVAMLKNIQSINVRGNHISDAAEFCRTIHPSVIHLNMQDNQLVAVDVCQCPPELLLGGNFLGDAAADTMPALFARGLRVLDLDSNSIGCDAALRLIAAAGQWPKMAHLGLNGNPTSGMTASRINAVNTNKALTGFQAVKPRPSESEADHNVRLTTGFRDFFRRRRPVPYFRKAQQDLKDIACSCELPAQTWAPLVVTNNTLTGVQCDHAPSPFRQRRWRTSISLLFSVFSFTHINMSGQLKGNRLAEFLEAFNAPRLIDIDLSNNGIVDVTDIVAALASCTSLRRVNLHGNPISDTAPLASLRGFAAAGPPATAAQAYP